MQALYLIGGCQRAGRPLLGGAGWYQYERGRILRVDVETGESRVVADHISPADVTPDEDPTILFKSGTVVDGRLYVCTQTEVLVFALPSFEKVGYVSHPWFNDVHHVRPTPHGTVLVANSGLDVVFECTLGGEIVREWSLMEADPWQRFSKTTDYRKVRSTKPHAVHPNHLFYVGDEIWVTRFEQGDAVCLSRERDPIRIAEERIHDGLVHEGLIYFTAVDGKVVVVDAGSLEPVEVIDLQPIHGRNELMGWCRGIAFDQAGHAWVGFTRLRPTQSRENVAWVQRGFKKMKGTHVACFDLKERRLLAQVDVEPLGLDAVFSIFDSSAIEIQPGSSVGSEDDALASRSEPGESGP